MISIFNKIYRRADVLAATEMYIHFQNKMQSSIDSQTVTSALVDLIKTTDITEEVFNELVLKDQRLLEIVLEYIDLN